MNLLGVKQAIEDLLGAQTVVEQLGGNVYPVGDDLQPLFVLDLAGNLKRRCSRIEDDGLTVVDQRGRHGADAAFLLGMRLQPLVHR